MEPASLYLVCVLAVFGVWLVGERIWALGSALAVGWSGRSIRARVGGPIVALALALTLIRIGSVSAATVPMHERIVLESDAPEPQPVTATRTAMTRMGMGAVAGTVNGSTYTVQPGDCLWRIARQILVADGIDPTGSRISELWRSIYDTNRTLIGADPNLIQPGQVLDIPKR